MLNIQTLPVTVYDGRYSDGSHVCFLGQGNPGIHTVNTSFCDTMESTQFRRGFLKAYSSGKNR